MIQSVFFILGLILSADVSSASSIESKCSVTGVAYRGVNYKYEVDLSSELLKVVESTSQDPARTSKVRVPFYSLLLTDDENGIFNSVLSFFSGYPGLHLYLDPLTANEVLLVKGIEIQASVEKVTTPLRTLGDRWFARLLAQDRSVVAEFLVTSSGLYFGRCK